MSEFVLQLKNINKYFGSNHVIRDVCMDIEKGAFVTFLGPSGCGKTTLLRMIAGFYEPDDGEILLNGKRIDKIPPYDRNTAMVFQEYALFPHMNVFENVSYGLDVRGESKAEMRRKVTTALEMMQLTGMEERYPSQMSGGQQQRVAVARALVMNPEALLLDEPLSNLDAKLRESVRVELRQIQQKMGLTTIYVTHDQSEALSMSDMIVVMRKGVIHQIGTAQQIYFEPRTTFVADFIGTTNLLQVKAVDSGTLLYGQSPLPTGRPVKTGDSYCLSLRPESLQLSATPGDNSRISIPATIAHKMFLGEKVRYILNDQYEKEWIVDAFDPGRQLLDGTVYLTCAKEKAWLIEEAEIDVDQ